MGAMNFQTWAGTKDRRAKTEDQKPNTYSGSIYLFALTTYY